MTWTEETTLFACAGDTRLGILTRPATPADTAVVVGRRATPWRHICLP